MADRFVVRHVGDTWSPQVRGRYEKLGGGTTEDISEAAVIGWTKKGHSRWTFYEGRYELVPVSITLKDTP